MILAKKLLKLILKLLIRFLVVMLMLVPLSEGVYAQERIAPGGKRAERIVQSGMASYYARSLHGNQTANGERYNHNAMTAAHRSLPFGTLLRVENPRTGVRVFVRINDRGPFIRGRVLDMSGEASRRLGMRQRGVLRVNYEIVDRSTLPSNIPPPRKRPRHL